MRRWRPPIDHPWNKSSRRREAQDKRDPAVRVREALKKQGPMSGNALSALLKMNVAAVLTSLRCIGAMREGTGPNTTWRLP